MKNLKIMIGLFVLMAFALTACGGTQAANDVMSVDNNMSDDMHDNMSDDMNDDMNDDMDDDMDDSSSDGDHDADMSDDEDMSDDSNMSDDENMSDDMMGETQAWFDHEFVDARTGETFTINDFKGKVVMIETMAMWCSNCLKQQGNVKAFHAELGERDDFVAIGLDIDPNENLSNLASYVTDNGFDWLYGVPTADVTADISRTFGAQYLNPPSTPIAIIDKEGNIHTLPFGIKSVQDLLDYVESFL